MEVKMFGTRGSIAVAGAEFQRYGGNTTCLRVLSGCIPTGQALVVDAGSGYLPLCKELLAEKIMQVDLLFTHYHSDHTVGLPLAPHTHIPTASMRAWGPLEHDRGPAEVFAEIMRPPHFPVSFATVRHRFNCRALREIGTQVLVIHPRGGFLLMPVHVFERAERDRKQLSFSGMRYSIGECLVVRMYKTRHPEYTVSYRFEERPSGRVFVFLTDHENTDAFPRDLLTHLQGAHLLIQDAQYSSARYKSGATAGFGHGTPDYCVDTAIAASIVRLGLTHHDPSANDDEVEQRLTEARAHAERRERSDIAHELFTCADYTTLTV